MKFIDLQTQYTHIQDRLQARFSDIIENTRFIMGKEVQEIEEKLSHYTQVPYAIGCANGTDALQIALMALDLKPGDEVITTSFSFFATGEVLALLQLTPVFVDICPNTYNIDPHLIETHITSKTKAIIAVSLYGQCADFDAINQLAARYQLPVIEDAAQSFGAQYKNKYSCNLSTIGTTSFFPSKPLGCYGDGGMMFTSNPDLAKKMKIIRNHGQESRYYHTHIGVNSRLDTLQAAVLLEKLPLFTKELERRNEIGARYTDKLKHLVKTPTNMPDQTHVYAQYTIEVNQRDNFCAKLEEHNIPTTVHYPLPLHMQPAFEYLQIKKGALPHSEHAAQHVVSLPMHPYLSTSQQDKIINIIEQSL